MGNNISDIIEQYLKRILEESDFDMVEIQRSELAEQFHCVPSQINYVISTRFTVDHGYIVESKRGGGGYIRIRRVKLDREHLVLEVLRSLGDEISQATGEALIERLYREGWVTRREAQMLQNMLRREVLAVDLPLRDKLRAKLLYGALQVIAAHRD
ncbi:transcriptional regulator CtsR [Alicyclobacillus hesperidum subsp. aegles]|uniref:Transcriptional regulator CtsR n=1 Tax=Alicyclobacillus hesperidum TaxID=89784 RepID=A0A1H2VGY3_9BACL|nr:CtsR family transcriptional regulator [Alicyclobacillus hesperidum]KRW91177.1 transcriptional regulator [Alicyclobacillus tengchongensis]GLG02564.1 transcriptional regulator CtsR [Alicyclobacillus hesperidum subsp. aegles]GLV12890.1 transcriptional regulator CtsR [Alicyclobacillus hesperidum]SDW67490.1 transcriptional regulator [Alicyclobacillus hesperidum]